ncbi:MAG: 30S ribosomal protein S20 [Candidatus Paceibacterota bacterium]
MPNTSSAKKELTKNVRKQEINLRAKNRMKQTVKDLTEAVARLEKVENIDKEELKAIEGTLRASYKAIDKAAKKGIIKKNNASNKKSGLAKKVNKLQEKSAKK